jgi:hypothetical protein
MLSFVLQESFTTLERSGPFLFSKALAREMSGTLGLLLEGVLIGNELGPPTRNVNFGNLAEVVESALEEEFGQAELAGRFHFSGNRANQACGLFPIAPLSRHNRQSLRNSSILTCQASRSIRTVSSCVPKKRTAAALLALLGN